MSGAGSYGAASESSHIEYALLYDGTDLEQYGQNHSEALADLEYARTMSNKGNRAYDGCVLLQRHVTVMRSAWATPAPALPAHSEGAQA